MAVQEGPQPHQDLSHAQLLSRDKFSGFHIIGKEKNRLPRGVFDAPSLRTFKARLDQAWAT